MTACSGGVDLRSYIALQGDAREGELEREGWRHRRRGELQA
jgi:hypothetical protein